MTHEQIYTSIHLHMQKCSLQQKCELSARLHSNRNKFFL